MKWTLTASTLTATAEGLNFVLEPVSWSIWDLAQAKESACFLANQKAVGLNPWTPGATVRLFFREPDSVPKEAHSGQRRPVCTKREK